MRILMLTQWFDPEPHFKGLEFARELKRRGHEVQVLTGFPNYPGGSLYPGYRVRPLQREVLEGIPVIRVPLYPSHDKSSLRRMANYFSFAFSASLLGTLLVKKADCMHVYHPPATVGFPALALNFFRRIPFVYDVQDLWPDTLGATGMLSQGPILKSVDWWCRRLYQRAACVAVLSPGFKKALIKRGVPPEKIEVIYNWSEEKQFLSCRKKQEQPLQHQAGDSPQHKERRQLAQSLGLQGKFNIIFAGTMGQAQALDAVLSAAARIAGKYPRIQFVFVGGGVDVPRLKQRAAEMKLDNVIFLPRLPLSEIGAVLELAEVLLVHLKDDPLFSITIPSKTQSYLAVGKPILMGVRGDAADLVKQAGAGITCTPQDPDSIAGAVEKLYNLQGPQLEALGRAGRDFYQRELSLVTGVKKFEAIFERIAKK
ncbi:glycosyltransferase family 4 protein [Candidatus Contubernalis alkaliaceticus]|uniref:glycosyltransferase family 4 protein n=1 Tax=Candidatus Contubernalis alkaliaceticus TaxID=338645 RepID=UPI001F4C162F|nr:glycosyltransferase family 4 protein [Candidatus Contubernalis alkalaceticus]UNC93619.1 glycosyltransferase family 4 protein [Candidatus Contubernalis alkalaceticus]